MKSIRQRETNFIQAATLCSYVASNFIVYSEPKFRQVRKCLGQINLKNNFPEILVSFEETHTEFVASSQNARAKQNLQGLGFEIKIAACAKNRYQTIMCGHGVKTFLSFGGQNFLGGDRFSNHGLQKATEKMIERNKSFEPCTHGRVSEKFVFTKMPSPSHLWKNN